MNNIRSLLTIATLVILSCTSNAQDTMNTHSSTVIFDYFRQKSVSIVYDIGTVILMPSDSVSFKEDNLYRTKITDTVDGYKEIFFKDKLLFRYEMKQGKIEGLGYCYYPFSSTIAIQGEFSNGKLHGLVFFQEENGKIIEAMKYKNGKFDELLFHWNLINSKKNLKKISKRMKRTGVIL